MRRVFFCFNCWSFIAKYHITQWYAGGDECNLALGAAGGTAGLAVATAACMTGVFCPLA